MAAREAAKRAANRSASEEDPSDESEPEEVALVGKNGKPKTTEEIRRQRRMLSNRESARRSRRRKLDHVATLDAQIANLQSDNAELTARLARSEATSAAAISESAALRLEVERLQAQLQLRVAGGAAPDAPLVAAVPPPVQVLLPGDEEQSGTARWCGGWGDRRLEGSARASLRQIQTAGSIPYPSFLKTE